MVRIEVIITLILTILPAICLLRIPSYLSTLRTHQQVEGGCEGGKMAGKMVRIMVIITLSCPPSCLSNPSNPDAQGRPEILDPKKLSTSKQ